MPEKRWKMKQNYEPWYFGWANCDNEAGKILEKLYPWPEFLPEDSETGKPSWIFLGTPGFGAPFHVDRVTYPSWQAQVIIIMQSEPENFKKSKQKTREI